MVLGARTPSQESNGPVRICRSRRVQSGSEGIRGSSQTSVLGSQRVKSGSEGDRGSSQGLRESECPVRF